MWQEICDLSPQVTCPDIISNLAARTDLDQVLKVFPLIFVTVHSRDIFRHSYLGGWSLMVRERNAVLGSEALRNQSTDRHTERSFVLAYCRYAGSMLCAHRLCSAQLEIRNKISCDGVVLVATKIACRIMNVVDPSRPPGVLLRTCIQRPNHYSTTYCAGEPPMCEATHFSTPLARLSSLFVIS